MSDLRASYTIVKRPNRTVSHYRGAVRRSRDLGVVWECEHEHLGNPHSALDCGAQEMARRRSAAAEPTTTEEQP